MWRASYHVKGFISCNSRTIKLNIPDLGGKKSMDIHTKWPPFRGTTCDRPFEHRTWRDLLLKLSILKVKCSRYRPGVAQRVGRGIALLFHDRGTRRGWVVSSTPRPHYTSWKDPVPILHESGWAPGPVWMGGKSRPHRDSIPDLPARSQSLYQLSYRAHEVKYCRQIKGAVWENNWWVQGNTSLWRRFTCITSVINSVCKEQYITACV